MNLRLKFILSFLCLSFFMALPVVYSIFKSQETRETIDKLVHVNIDEIEYSSRINFQIQRIKSNLRELMLENAIDTEKREITKALNTVKTELTVLEKNGLRWRNAILSDMAEEEEEEGFSEELELKELDKLLKLIGKFEFLIHQFIAIYNENPADINRYQKFFEHDIEPISRDIQKAVKILHEEAVVEARAEGERFEDALKMNEQVITWAIFSAFLLAVFLGVMISIYVTKPLNQLQALSRRVSEDNLNERAKILSNDEIGELARSYNQMLDLIRDNIDEKNKKDIELQQINQSLEKRVEERTKVLRQAQVEAETANKVKSQFLSHMSHELRTPLNEMIGYAQLLQISEEKEWNDRQRKGVTRILKSGEYLIALIEQLLEFNDIERGNLTLNVATLNPVDVINTCIGMLTTEAQMKGVSINHHYQNKHVPLLKSDETRLQQVLLNLLSNAVKYNKPDGTVDITYLEADNNRLRILISDTGVGIHEELKDKLFMPFERLGHETSTIGGVGIGLVLSKRIITKLNGSIGFEDQINEGATFWIELPLSRG